MTKLNTIQKRGNLNEVHAIDEVGNGSAHHEYLIRKATDGEVVGHIQFQHGPRFEEGSINGVATTDLLEICRNQISSFQEGDFRTREGAIALTHIEEALLWLNKRSEDRLERGVLGTVTK